MKLVNDDELETILEMVAYGTRRLDFSVASFCGYDSFGTATQSTDLALSLVEAKCFDYEIKMQSGRSGTRVDLAFNSAREGGFTGSVQADGNTPALAICAALIKALKLDGPAGHKEEFTNEARLQAYEDCTEVARELGYPSLTEALEDLELFKADPARRGSQ